MIVCDTASKGTLASINWVCHIIRDIKLISVKSVSEMEDKFLCLVTDGTKAVDYFQRRR